MMMNVKKTKMMILNGEMKDPIEIRGEKIEEEKSFPYLGVPIAARESSSCEEVAVRVAKAVKVFRALHYSLWRRKQVGGDQSSDLSRSCITGVIVWM